MIIGAHVVIYSTNSPADRDFFSNVLGMASADAGEGFLIFGLPPAEVAVHPADLSGKHELYLMCDDIEGFIAQMRALPLPCTDAQDLGWGVLATLTLPGGGLLGVYQPRHAQPASMKAPATAKKATKQGPAKKSASKKGAKKR